MQMLTSISALIRVIVLSNLCFDCDLSLLSRLKNPTQYNPKDEVIILPQDYYDEIIDDFTEKLITFWTEARRNTNTEYVSKEIYSLRPTGLIDVADPSIHSTTVKRRTHEPVLQESEIVLEERPTISDIYLESNKTTDSLYSSVSVSSPIETSTEVSEKVSVRTWRPYFQNVPVFKNRHRFFETPSAISIHANYVPPQKPYLNFLKNTLNSNDITYQLEYTTPPRPTVKVVKVLYRPKDMERDFPSRIKGRVKARKGKHKNLLRHNLRSSFKCYTCGMNLTGLSDSSCYDAFEEAGNLGTKREMKTKCQATDGYDNGCFKRFLDVGTAYIERGCRAFPPTRGKSYASKRLAKVELLMKRVSQGCMVSPHATLTPFSKAVSLYTRYHVCVCKTTRCNVATSQTPSICIAHFITAYILLLE